MNTQTKCTIHTSSGELFTIVFKENNSLVERVVDDLSKHFDSVIVSPPKCNDAQGQENLCGGVEVTAIRMHKVDTANSDFRDIGEVLKKVWPGDSKRATLKEITNGITIHELRCDTKQE